MRHPSLWRDLAELRADLLGDRLWGGSLLIDVVTGSDVTLGGSNVAAGAAPILKAATT
jgi:hypothetical protein